MGARLIWTAFIFYGFLNDFFPILYGFNLDTSVPIVKTGPADSYFGFSLAQHQIYRDEDAPDGDAIRVFDRSVLLVGAPRDNITDEPSAVLRKLKRPGVVYACPLTSRQDDCESVKIHRLEPTANEDRADQWMGVSVSSQQGATDGNGKAVACAHRYTKRGTDFEIALGLCIVITNLLEEEDYLEPCAGLPSGKAHGEFGYCQAGTSLDISSEGDVLLGTPGTYNWRGAVFKNDIRDELGGTKKWTFSPTEDPIKGKDVPPTVNAYNSYLGYASKIGTLVRNEQTYVAGAPRSNDVGEVFLFTQGKDYLVPELKLSGKQFGAAFGHDIAVLDVNGDGLDDLVVSAPFHLWTAVGENINMGGAVYVYLNGLQGLTSTTQPAVITRRMTLAECKKVDCQNARFGMSIARIGDLDLDGYEDLAVGAPYEGQGAVYVFRGGPGGLLADYSQRVAPLDFPSSVGRSLRTFGYALSSGIDMDNNGYTDVAVGAYASTQVVLLRARPVVNVTLSLTGSPSLIDPAVTRCDADKTTTNNCFKITISAAFHAKPRDRFTAGLEITYRLEAEVFAGSKVSRVFFKGSPDPNRNYEINGTLAIKQFNEGAYNPDALRKKEHIVYLSSGNRDFLNPIPIRLTYRLTPKSAPSMRPGDSTLPDINNYPIVNEAAAVQHLSVDFVKNCGVDLECQSNLRVIGEFEQLDRDDQGGPLFKIDQNKELRLKVSVNNAGEDAHLSLVYIHRPPHVAFIGMDKESTDATYCEPAGELIECFVGNPLRSNKKVEFVVRFNMDAVRVSSSVLPFMLTANTTSRDAAPDDNVFRINLRVVIETDMLVRGISDVPEVFYSGEQYGVSAVQYDDEIGMQVVHSYEVKNDGPGQIRNASVFISWPYELASRYDHGKYLLYLLEQPTVDGVAVCYVPSDMVNPEKIRKRPRTAEGNATTTASPADDASGNQGNGQQARRRRDALAAEVTSGRSSKVVSLDCESQTAKCFTFQCVVPDLRPGTSVVISMTSRLWNSTFNEEYRHVDQVRIYSYARIEINSDASVEQRDKTNDVARALTIAYPAFLKAEDTQLPIWIIVLAVIGALIILVVLIIILWKCGFFKRKTPDDMYRGKVERKKKKKSSAAAAGDDFYDD